MANDNTFIIRLRPGRKPQRLDDCSTLCLFRGNDGVNEFLARGGVSTSNELIRFVLTHLGRGYRNVEAPAEFAITPGCTAVQVKDSKSEGYLFGRNYDFKPHTMMIIQTEPDDGYRSVCSVDTSFITEAFGKAGRLIPTDLLMKLGIYIPVDGMNEKGLAMSVNMIFDDVIIEQDRGQTRQLIVTAVRTLLDKAATVDEAIAMLEKSDMRSWEGFFCHMAIADASGKSVAAEYINNELAIVPTPVVTNFYLKEGPKFGIGTEQSHIRYDRIMEYLKDHEESSHAELRDVFARAAKSNFPDDFHTTEWSIVYDQEKLTATYYRREDYTHAWKIELKNI